MTVQAGIELDLDIAELVGEMPVVPCEHPDHADDPEWHDGAAGQYAQGLCTSCGHVGPFLAICQKFIDLALASNLRCKKCNHVDLGVRVLRLFGPVKP